MHTVRRAFQYAIFDQFDRKCKIFVWLCQIAKNTYYSFCKKNKHVGTEADLEQLESVSDLEECLIQKAEAFEIHKKLHALDEPYKEARTKRYLRERHYSRRIKCGFRRNSYAYVKG